MAGRWELTDEQWLIVEPILRASRRADNRGRPWHDTRAVLIRSAIHQLLNEYLEGGVPALVGDGSLGWVGRWRQDPLTHD
jgi:hypothetical protein